MSSDKKEILKLIKRFLDEEDIAYFNSDNKIYFNPNGSLEILVGYLTLPYMDIDIRETSAEKIIEALEPYKILNEAFFFEKLNKGDITQEEQKVILNTKKLYQLKHLYSHKINEDLEEYLEEYLEDDVKEEIFKKPFMDVFSMADLENSKKLLVEDCIWIRLCTKIKFNQMLSHGFIPLRKDEIFEDFLAGKSLEEIKYWFPKESKNFFKILEGEYDCKEETFAYWKYATQSYLQEEALKTARSIDLLMVFPDLIYKESKRPVNNMEMFKVPDYLKIHNVTGDTIILDGISYFYSPVTRYAQGMTRSLYFNKYKNKKSNKYCGTFYYFEPESTTYLLYENFLIGRTKSEVCLDLINKSKNPTEYQDLIDQIQDIMAKPTYNKIFENKLIMTLKEAVKYIKYWDYELKYNVLSKNNNYKRYWDFGYSSEDVLDQTICKLAKESKFDVVIFEYVVGSHQIVKEILDVRDRGDSFRHLAYL